MALFRKNADPLDKEMQRLEEASRRLVEQMRDIETQISTPTESEPSSTPVFRGATFKGGDYDKRENTFQHRSLKIQKRRMRNRVIILGAILMFLFILVWRTLFSPNAFN